MATGNATAKPFVCQKSDGEGESDLEANVFDDESSRHSVFPRARPQSDSSVNPELTDSRGGSWHRVAFGRCHEASDNESDSDSDGNAPTDDRRAEEEQLTHALVTGLLPEVDHDNNGQQQQGRMMGLELE
jgi:hypothetical protein